MEKQIIKELIGGGEYLTPSQASRDTGYSVTAITYQLKKHTGRKIDYIVQNGITLVKLDDTQMYSLHRKGREQVCIFCYKKDLV